MRWLAWGLLAALPCGASAEDARLTELRGMLVPMRKVPVGLGVRGATPRITVIKHKLRDWIEALLIPLAWDGGPEALARQLNEELKQWELLCAYNPKSGETQCPEWSLLGYLNGIKLYRPPRSEFLVLQTGVGIECGFDESAYAYEWTGDRWRRLWQSEQDDYRDKKYLPQRLEGLISPTDYRPDADKSTHLWLTLGVEPWCSSSWHDVYMRVWRTDAGVAEPKLLLDEREWAWLSEPILGTVGRDDVLVEYSVVLSGVGPSRRQVRHYAVTRAKIERADPIALGPRNFVDEWLTRPWEESASWTEPRNRPALSVRHRKNASSDLESTTMHCLQSRDLWQVKSGYSIAPEKEPVEYFLVRWRPPFRFTMVDVRDRPWAGCTEEDPEANEERTLFAGQDWR